MTLPLPADLAAGTRFGAYRINRLLGKGGMGAVYEATHLSDGRVVALKVLSVDLDKMDARQRFLLEGQSAARINHPNAVYIYGTEEIDGAPAIIMELVPGGTLEDKVRERGPLPVAESIDDILQVIDGLDAALSAGVLHRDVKPSNCFVGAQGEVKIGDFGLSKPVDSDQQMHLTKSGLFLGTPVYSSPEQLLGEKLDARSDIYAVGVTWYHLLTGQLPYQSSGSMMQVVAAVLNGAPVPLTTIRPDVPEGVAAVVMKSMARKADDRYQSYAEFREAVAALRPREATSATVWDRVRAWVVDATVLSTATWVAMFAVLAIAGVRRNDADLAQQWLQAFVEIVLALLIQAIPEGLRGATLGKWLVGLRVQTTDGGLPGYARAAARALMWASTSVIALGVQSLLVTPGQKVSGMLLVSLLLRSLFLLTLRKGKGLVLLHDVVTGTRVVRPVGAIEQRRTDIVRAVAPTLSGTEQQLGPYTVLGSLTPGSTAMRGWDSAMRRHVWIIPATPGTPETSPARRGLARLSRLRWVAGRRSGTENWDAFEAPSGEPLPERLKRPVPWTDQQAWMLDLTDEYERAAADGTTPALTDVDALWITPTNRVIIPELVAAYDPNDSASDSAADSGRDAGVTFISAFIRRVQQSNHEVQQLPMHAKTVLGATQRARSVSDVERAIRSTLGRPAVISQLRRFGLMAVTLGPLVACPVAGYVGADSQQRRDPLGSTLEGLAQFVADSNQVLGVGTPGSGAPGTPDSAQGIGVKLGRTARTLRLPFLYPDDYRPTAEVRRRETRLSEVYMASVLPLQSTDTSKVTWPRSATQKAVAAEIMQRHATIDPSELLAARQLVDSTWQGKPPGTAIALSSRFIPLLTGVISAAFFAGVSLLLALTVRRGPLLRGFQLDVVNRNGEPAGRMRLFWRSVITWSPFLLLVLLVYGIAFTPEGWGGVVAPIVFVVIPLVWIYGLVTAIRTPSRGLADRLAGTWLVPE